MYALTEPSRADAGPGPDVCAVYHVGMYVHRFPATLTVCTRPSLSERLHRDAPSSPCLTIKIAGALRRSLCRLPMKQLVTISVRGHDCHSRYGLLRPSSFDEKFLPFGVVALSVVFGLVPGFISS